MSRRKCCCGCPGQCLVRAEGVDPHDDLQMYFKPEEMGFTRLEDVLCTVPDTATPCDTANDETFILPWVAQTPSAPSIHWTFFERYLQYDTGVKQDLIDCVVSPDELQNGGDLAIDLRCRCALPDKPDLCWWILTMVWDYSGFNPEYESAYSWEYYGNLNFKTKDEYKFTFRDENHSGAVCGAHPDELFISEVP